jgi:cytochrome P450 family 144
MVRAPFMPGSLDDFFDRHAIEHPHRLYEVLRSELPLSRVGDTGVHPVASWDLIDEVLQREDDFSANLTGVLVRGDDGTPSIFPLPDLGGNHVIATADEPDHRVHRAIAQPRLAPKVVAALEDKIVTWAHDAFDPWVAAGGGDFAAIAELIPALAVADVLGLPVVDVSLHRTWAMMGGDILAGVMGPDQLVKLATESGRMSEYLGEHLDAHAARTDTDAAFPSDAPMLASLAFAVRQGSISRIEAIGIAVVMFGAAGESTAALIASCGLRLAENPDLAATLRAEPELIPRFIEEIVRLESPFKFHYRVVKRSCSLAGYELEAGDRLLLLWASANRDSAYFEEPDVLRLDRRHPKQHMGFGRGGHFCIGAPLARLEARVVVEQLLSRTQSLSLDRSTPPRYANSIFIRRLESVSILVAPA